MSPNTRIEEICRKMPKVELHAHLSGCIPKQFIQQQLKRANQETSQAAQKINSASVNNETSMNKDGEKRSMSQCFEVFAVVHQAIQNLETLYAATLAVLDNFAADGVVHLELRTTPKTFTTAGMSTSKRQYVDTVVQAIRDWRDSRATGMNREQGSVMTVKLLVSLDRGRPLHDAQENLALALQLAADVSLSGLVAGVEVCGDPCKGDLRSLVPLLQEAACSGLPVLLHVCEVDSKDCEQEAIEVLQSVNVRRLGHATFVGASSYANAGGSQLKQRILQANIPIGKLNNLLYAQTDDPGVFQTSLSEEFILLAKAFCLSAAQLQILSRAAAEASLLSEGEKRQLITRIDDYFQSLVDH